MKIVFVFLVATGILLQSFSKFAIMLDFQLNRDFIANNLCVQRDVKDNCCKGSCHLKNKLSDDEQKQKLPASIKNAEDFQVCENYFVFDINLYQNKTDYINQYTVSETVSFSSSLYHPPKI